MDIFYIELLLLLFPSSLVEMRRKRINLLSTSPAKQKVIGLGWSPWGQIMISNSVMIIIKNISQVSALSVQESQIT